MSQTRLSILDQSPIPTNRTATDALQATLELAQAAERWGYHRYWLAEHHGLLGLADPCPEILLTRIASLTEKIRVGTGGIMLPYYSPFKIVEQFRMLTQSRSMGDRSHSPVACSPRSCKMPAPTAKPSSFPMRNAACISSMVSIRLRKNG